MNLQEIYANAEQMEEQYEQAKKSTTFARTQDEIDRVYSRIDKLQAKVKQLRAKAERNRDKHYAELEKYPSWWGDTKLKPIAEELMRRIPKLKSYYVIGSFGLNAETSIWFFEDEQGFTKDYKTDEVVGSLTFHSGMYVWTGKVINRYADGTIGALNGGNKEMVETKSIEQLETILKLSIKEHKSRNK